MLAILHQTILYSTYDPL